MPTPSIYYRMEREAEEMRARISELEEALDMAFTQYLAFFAQTKMPKEMVASHERILTKIKTALHPPATPEKEGEAE